MLTALWSTPLYADVRAKNELVIATRDKAITNRFAELVLKKVYASLGIPVRFQVYPDARSVMEANKGHADGGAARLSVVLNTYQNLRLVPVPLFYSELSAFVRSDYALDISDWESLGQYRLATVQGFKLVQDKLADFSLHTFSTSQEVIQRVEASRIEVGVLNRFLGQLAAQRLNAKFVKDVSPPLERLPVFHMVHKNQEHLVPKLTDALRDMQDRGELQSLWNTFVQEHLAKANEANRTQETD
ncbi:transporter substrate-binding domain-containing protein [Magnetovibrio sp. PR-2]|uniref:substrate-binding periplasmic protein n=1 Tax=Magnetovibrio sp. PR-2 TaxID=3120356 RepID=UPI002FCE510C